jgi:hypothetical protein
MTRTKPRNAVRTVLAAMLPRFAGLRLQVLHDPGASSALAA